ncbi:MAG: sn-glycerol-3-phosphate ABC transporter ATP-binding protein UgpC [Deltaproteobacteria bacterium]|nr:sn-glycerol-3-phosphate ABC transporter ATP-binding protein UgpC [Deltaproteobacteria bacterium]
MATVELRGVCKSYGAVHVVRGVDLAIADGEFLVLVGPSGCGKSTVLRMIAGLEEVTEGELRIGDRDVRGVVPRDRDIAMVFQSYALYPHMTVRENLAFGLRVRKFPKEDIATRVQEVAAVLELDLLLDRLPKELSGGQRQRVAMGRAMVRRPKAFLFDEPLSNLDAALRSQMRVEIKRLHRELGATMVYVTHDQVEAMTLADRIALLHQGTLQQVGRPDELYDRPANTFVAGFIGSPAMNLLDGTLGGDRDTPVVCAADAVIPVLADGLPADLAAGARVRLGVRPHDLALADAGAASPAVGFRGTVEVVEPLGWEVHLHVRGEFGTLTARLERSVLPAPFGAGQPVRLVVDPSKVHLFDGESGRRLEAGSPGRV